VGIKTMNHYLLRNGIINHSIADLALVAKIFPLFV
jgi:hypothetical protein